MAKTLIGNIKGVKGDKGDKGDRGEQGIQGIQGVQGIQGERGEQGIQGEKGKPGAIQTVNGQTPDENGNVNVKGGGVSSWNDLTDKPFGDNRTFAPLNITFDGDITNHESFEMSEGVYLVKVSDAVLTTDDLIGGTLTMVLDGEESETVLTNESFADMGKNGIPAIISAEEYWMVVYGDASAIGYPLSTGVWFIHQEMTMFVKSLSNPNVTITTGELKKIDNKFIDAEWIATTTEVKADTPILEATITGSSAVNETTDIAFKEGQKYTVVFDGVEYACVGFDAGVVLGGTAGDCFGMGDFMVAAGQGGGIYPFFIWDGGTGGTNVTCATTTEDEHTFAIYEMAESVVPLPPKFMPELTQVILKSTTEGSEKKFRVTVDDTGALTAVEVS